LELPAAKDLSITALVRSSEKAKLLESNFSIKAVIGSTHDEAILWKHASEAQIVISTVDADDLPAIKTILRGMKERHTNTGEVPVLIHTSGTGVLTTGDRGLKAGENIYNDSKPESIASLAPSQPHRDVDLAIVEADQEGYIKSYIILPSTIYGIAEHPLAKAGISNPYSQQIPDLVRVSLARGEAGVVGKGAAVWGDVHIDDNSALYATVLEGVLNKSPALGHGVDGFYFGISGEHSWYEISKEIAEVLVEKGRSKSSEPTPFTEEEFVRYFGSVQRGYGFGTSSRGIADHSRAIGWKPKFTKEDMIASIKVEIQDVIDKGIPLKAKGVN